MKNKQKQQSITMVITFTSEVTGFWKLSDFFQQYSSNWKRKLGHTHGEEKFLFFKQNINKLSKCFLAPVLS